MNPLENDLEYVLASEEEIRVRVRALGEQIVADYRACGVEEVTLVALANGAMIFAADLMRSMPMALRLDCVRVTSYLDATSPQSEPKILDNVRLDLRGRHVLMVDDILDTGKTCSTMAAMLHSKGLASLKTCMLLDKKARRIVPFEADYVGFSIPNAFVVGYGLDYAERYRNLPCIGVLKPALQP